MFFGPFEVSFVLGRGDDGGGSNKVGINCPVITPFEYATALAKAIPTTAEPSVLDAISGMLESLARATDVPSDGVHAPSPERRTVFEHMKGSIVTLAVFSDQ